MFGNLFDLKSYELNFDNDKSIEFKKTDSYREFKKILPTINCNNIDYIIGDILFNEESKEFLVFSFYTHLEDYGFNTIGFFRIKNEEYFFKTPTLFSIQDGGNEIIPFEFIKLNEFKNTTCFKKVGNILLNRNFILKKIKKLYGDSNFEYIIDECFKNLFDIIQEMTDIKLMIKDKEKNDYYITFINSLVNRDIFQKDFKFYPKLWIVNNISDVFTYHGQISLSIISRNNKDKSVINEKFISYFDVNSFNSIIKLEDENERIDYKYLSEYLDKHYRFLREEDENIDYYNKLLLSFL